MEWIHFSWLTLYMLATLYTFGWDVRMDWKLGQLLRAGYGLGVFPYKSIYYFAIGADLILRFGWTATCPSLVWRQVDVLQKYLWLLPVLSTIEILRRAMWLVLRLESEHLHNTEGFRRVDVVPLHFDHAVKEQEAKKEKAAADKSRRFEVLIEGLVYLAVVGILALAAVSDIADPTRSFGNKTSV